MLAVVLAVCAGLVVLRVTRSGTDAPPGPVRTPTGTSSSAAQAWPGDLPAGTLFVGAGGSVAAIDAARGTPTRTSVETGPVGTAFTRLDGGVLVWTTETRGARVVLADGLSLHPVSGGLRSATAFLPGPDGLVWARSASRSDGTRWRLVDAEGRQRRGAVVDGRVVGDGAGGLLSVGTRGVRPAFPRPRRSWEPGEVVASGPDGYVVRSCTDPDCRFTLHHHRDDRPTRMDTAVGAVTSGGTLSPGNRFLAVTETVGGTSTLRVSVVATGQVLDIFSAPGGSTSDAVWLDDRWLALVSEGGLVLYDAADDRVVTPAVGLHGVGPLAWRPA